MGSAAAVPILKPVVPAICRLETVPVVADEADGIAAGDGVTVTVGVVVDMEVDGASLIVTVAGVVVDKTFSLV